MKVDRFFLVLLFFIFLILATGFIATNRGALFDRTFSSSTEGLPEARLPETVELKDGDVYEMRVFAVKKKIGGSFVRMLSYNGSIPGPIIKIPQDAKVIINLQNDTDLPETLHAHGIRMDSEYDGIPQLSQAEIPPGGSFSYHLKFPDAGIFWYHPHVREDYTQESGLYGNFLVAPKKADYWDPVNVEVPLFVDDILTEKGKLVPFQKDIIDHTLTGRFGNIFLLNGVEGYNLTVKKGDIARFYFTNSANTRTFNLDIEGAKMKLVGGDIGAYEKDKWVGSVIISPSERAIVEMLFDTPGIHSLENVTPDGRTVIGTVTVEEEPTARSYESDFNTLKTHQDTIRSIDPFRSYLDKAPDMRLELVLDLVGKMKEVDMGHDHSAMDMDSGGKVKDGIEWSDGAAEANRKSDMTTVFWKIRDVETQKEGMAIDWQFKTGEKVMINVRNDDTGPHSMQHPIHFHGQRFLVAKVNGVKQDNLVWKDTVLVPSGGSVDILLDASNPGPWMAHCHIAEHLGAGMMFHFKVE